MRRDTADTQPPAKDNSHSALTDFCGQFVQSLVYSGVEEPLRGLAQLGSQRWDDAIKSGFHAIGVDKPQKTTMGSAGWYGDQLGGAIGMMAPYMLLHTGVKAGATKLFGETAIRESVLNASASRAAFTLAGKDAALNASTGLVYGLLRPVDDAQASRLKNGLGDAFVFGALGGSNSLIGSGLGRGVSALERSQLAAPLKSTLSTALRVPVLPGVASAAPGGFLSAEVNAWKQDKPYASASDIKESMAGMAFVGGAFGAAHWAGGRLEARNITNKLTPEKTDADHIAGRFGRLRDLNAGRFSSSFVDTMLDRTGNSNYNFGWRIELTRALSQLKRNGSIEDKRLDLPSPRMPKTEGVTEAQARAVRQQTENVFRDLIKDPNFDEQRLHKLLGADGALGKMFPSIFGEYKTSGGIVGRPQHGGHVYDLDAHTGVVVTNLPRVAGFDMLSSKEKLNTIWAALLHDAGKKANETDPDHEWVSTAYAWNVLGTLGYPPQRIQRIVDLTSRHAEASYLPSTVHTQLQTQHQIDDLAASMRYPTMPMQTRILNEADIRGITPDASYFKPPVEQHLNNVTYKLDGRAPILSQYSMPVLTSDIPQEFGLHQPASHYAYFVHALNSAPNFFEHLNRTQSRDNNFTAELMTPSSRRFYSPDSPAFNAVVAAPWENISQSLPGERFSAGSNDWDGHVNRVREWLNTPQAQETALRVDQQLRALGFGANDVTPLSALADARKQLSQFDTLDELYAHTGPTDPLRLAHEVVLSALTEPQNAGAAENTTTLVNPTVVGISALRKPGTTVAFESPSDRIIDRLLGDQPKPDWMSGGAPLSANHLLIPRSVVEPLIKNNMPLVILEPDRKKE